LLLHLLDHLLRHLLCELFDLARGGHLDLLQPTLEVRQFKSPPLPKGQRTFGVCLPQLFQNLLWRVGKRLRHLDRACGPLHLVYWCVNL
jgi:hypothetical protein